MSIHWYLNRLRRMTPQEVSWRLRDEVVKRRWRGLKGQGAPSRARTLDFRVRAARRCDARISTPRRPPDIVAAAERILAGRIRLVRARHAAAARRERLVHRSRFRPRRAERRLYVRHRRTRSGGGRQSHLHAVAPDPCHAAGVRLRADRPRRIRRTRRRPIAELVAGQSVPHRDPLGGRHRMRLAPHGLCLDAAPIGGVAWRRATCSKIRRWRVARSIAINSISAACAATVRPRTII